MSKKEQLRQWLIEKGIARTSDVIKWGVKNYCNDAERLARKLAEDGYIARINDKKKLKLYGKTRESVWKTIRKKA